MAILQKTTKIESSHWYTLSGESCHQVPKKDGSPRPTNLRDARKYGLFPSVTGILGIFAKPGLDRWKLKQVALASIEAQLKKGETEDSYSNRVIEDAFNQVTEAADFGTLVHQAVEDFVTIGKEYRGQDVSLRGEDYKMEIFLDPVSKWLTDSKITCKASESVVVSERHGYAGTMDFGFTYGTHGIGVIDFKTRKTKPGEEVKSYEFQDMQIAAYGATFWAKELNITEEEALEKMVGANVYISSTEPGRMDVVKYLPKDLLACWPTFLGACDMWRYLKKYDPRAITKRIGIPEIKTDVSDIDKIFKEGDKKRSDGQESQAGGLGSAQIVKDKETPREEQGDTQDSLTVFPFGTHKGKLLSDLSLAFLNKFLTSKQYADKRESNKDLVTAIELHLRNK